jgi:transposase
MPWKECHVMDERLRFVARLLEGETMTTLCQEFGISRKTGYKLYQRYRRVGVQCLADHNRRPYRHADQLPTVVEQTIVRVKRSSPTGRA